jgi:hypothetical protein
MVAEYLKFGALGIGALSLGYATLLLRQELAKAQPQPESKKLIWSYMGFGIALFVAAALLQAGEKWMEMRPPASTLAADIRVIVDSIDTRLDEKFHMAVTANNRDEVLRFTKNLCDDLKRIAAKVGGEQPRCMSLR